MSEPFADKDNRIEGAGFQKFLLPVGTLVVVLIAVYFFLNQDTQAQPLPDVSLVGPAVSIYDPSAQQPYRVGVPVVISAHAVSDSPIASLDLFVNGELVAVQAAPAGTGDTYSAKFFFTAPEPGNYSLLIQGKDSNHHIGYSDPFWLAATNRQVGENPDGEDPDNFESSMAFPAAPAGPSEPMIAPNSSQQPDPGKPYTPTQNGGNPSTEPTDPPAAPALYVQQDACNFVLSIQDNSDNEEGFSIYRDDGVNGFVLISSLAGQSDQDWITFNDNLHFDAHTYFVSAFNQLGASASNVVYLASDYSACTPIVVGQLPSPPSIFVQLVSLLPENPVEQGYCYRSFDGEPFARWPDNGFFDFSPQGELMDGEIISLLMENLGEDGEAAPKSLNLACWEWDGSQAYFIGEVVFDPLDFGEGQAKKIEGIGLDASLLYGMFEDTSFDPSSAAVQLELFDESLPMVHSELSESFQACINRLHPDSPVGIKNVTCQPWPQYSEEDPQPYLVFDPYCGSASTCNSYSDWIKKEENGEGKLGFRIFETSPQGIAIKNISSPYRFVDLVTPMDCHVSRNFQVQMFFNTKNGPLLYGPISDKVYLPICIDDVGLPGAEIAQYRFVEITFSTFEVLDLDDGSLLGIKDVSLEMYGHLYVNNGSYPFDLSIVPPATLPAIQNYLRSGGAHSLSAINLGKWGFEQEGLHWGAPNSNIGYADYSGLVFLADWRFCESNIAYGCQIWGNPSSESEYKSENNKLIILVTPNKPFVIGSNIWDSDQMSGHDNVCLGTTTFLGGDLSQIDALDGTSFSLVWDGESGECHITGSLAVLQPSSQ